MDDIHHYIPVSCDLYDQLTHYAVKRQPVVIRMNHNDISEVSGLITDVFTKNHEEFCVVGNQVFRLDFIQQILPGDE